MSHPRTSGIDRYYVVCVAVVLVPLAHSFGVGGSIRRLCLPQPVVHPPRSTLTSEAPSSLDLHSAQWRRSAQMSSRNEDSESWLEKAAQLRKEVQELEASVGSRRSPSDQPPTRNMEYTDISDSTWTLTYRFADQPESESDLATDNSNDSQEQRRRFFTGKLTVNFRNDGYTDRVAFESTGPTSESSDAIKIWGWDIELSKDKESNDVETEYLLFSVDFKLASDTSNDPPPKDRLYFQARVERSPASRSISLAAGTITVKKDVVPNMARWGLFSPAGILAQFRYVGDFVAKPVAPMDVKTIDSTNF